MNKYNSYLRWFVMGLGVVMLLFAAGCAKNNAEEVAKEPENPAVAVSASQPIEDHYAIFHTSEGDFTVRLYGSKTPITVKNFDYLVKKGYYDKLIFHRVIEDFMIQGGDPKGNGTGGPGYEILDEFVKDLHFDKAGVLAMANRGPNTGGSQFFITVGPTPWLDNKHTIFGVVVRGLDVVEKISQVKTDKKDKPVMPVVIESITLEPLSKDGK